MPSYAAFLGHQPHISVAELRATIPGMTVTRVLHPRASIGGSRDLVIFDSPAKIDPAYLGTLGGTIAIAEQLDVSQTGDEALEALPKILADRTGHVRGKITFAIRASGLPPKKVRELYRTCKEFLRKNGRNVRYVGSEHIAAAPVLLHDAGLIDGKHGCELTIVAERKDDTDFLWIGRTLAAQDVDAYARRDVGKPVRDTTVGLLPPKLAQILLNFGAFLVPAKSGNRGGGALTVLDPFCGTGVIPMECLLRGWNALASDLSLKAVNGCTKNLEWLRKETGIKKSAVASTVWKQDARKPFELKAPPDVIVTETTLGPPLASRPTARDVQAHRRESEELQRAFLENMAATLPGVPLVVTWPVWYLRKEQVWLEKIWDALGVIGYRATLPPGVDVSAERRVSLVYRRPDQFVGREIVLLQPARKR